MSVIALGILVGDAMSLSVESGIGRLVHGTRTGCCLPVVLAYGVCEENGRWRLIDPHIEGYDEVDGMIESGENFVSVTGRWYTYTSGFWAITQRARHWRTQGWWEDGTPLAQADEDAIRASLADNGYPWQRHGDVTQTVILWSGVAHNAGALFTFAILLTSLAWVPAGIRRQKAGRTIARGLCPVCAYDMRGLVRCPECGWLPAGEH